MLELLSTPFFQKVLLAGLLASIASGIIGTLIVVKKISSISGGLSHAAFGGIGLGYLLGFNPMFGAFGFTLLCSIAIGFAYLHLRTSLDTLISVMWSLGMALGILFINLAPGYVPDLNGYLFGSILLVPTDYLLLISGIDLLILLCIYKVYPALRAVTFDEEFSLVLKLPVHLLFLLLMALSALTIITLIRVVGIILVVALLTIPAACARLLANDLKIMMLLAVLIAASCTLTGLLLSYLLPYYWQLSLPPGPLIILLTTVLYGILSIWKKWPLKSLCK